MSLTPNSLKYLHGVPVSNRFSVAGKCPSSPSECRALFFLHFNMPQSVPRTQVPRRNFNAFQIPCGHAGCKRFFKTAAGRTKHILSAHPIVPSPPPDAQYDTDNDTNMDIGSFQDDADSLGQMDHRNSEPEESRSSPTPDSDGIGTEFGTEFFGPGDSLYRNYHTLLNGYFFLVPSL